MQQQHLTFAVSENLLRNVPKFFTSPDAILTELFQNAFRAGATAVMIQCRTEGHNISIWDNGVGTSPEVLVNAGQSGWDKKSPAVNPAGLGAFALLRKEYVKEVSYRSRDWMMVLSEDSITNGATVEYGYPVINGTQVGIWLANGVSYSLDRIARARGTYPMRFEISFDDAELKVLDPLPLFEKEYLHLEIPEVGVVTLGSRPDPKNVFTSNSRRLAMWQHAVIGGLGSALDEAAKQLSNKIVYGCLNGIDSSDLVWVWEIDPACRVSPGLPNRDTLIQDKHLTTAAWKIVEAVDQYLSSAFDLQKLALVQKVDGVKGVKKLLEEHRLDDTGFSEYLINHHAGALMLQFGFIEVSFEDPAEDNFYFDYEDALQLDAGYSRSIQFLRPELVMDIPDDGMAVCMNLQGVPSRYRHDAQKPEIRVEGLKHTGGAVAFAKRITVNGVQVEYLVRSTGRPGYCERDDDVENDPYVWKCEALDQAEDADSLFMVVTSTPQRFLAALNKYESYESIRAFFARYRYDADTLEGFYHDEHGDFDFDDVRIKEELSRPALRALLGIDRADAMALNIANVSNFLEFVKEARWEFKHLHGNSIVMKVLVYSLLVMVNTVMWTAEKYKETLERRVKKLAGSAEQLPFQPIPAQSS